MRYQSIISSKLKPAIAGFVAVVLVISQLAMSHAMAGMPDHGIANSSVSSSMNHRLDKLDNSFGSTVVDHLALKLDLDDRHTNHDDQGSHCAALCITALAPLEAGIVGPMSSETTYSGHRQVGLSKKLAGIKRPPRI